MAAFMFLVPDTAAGIWPWTLTPLTSRVIAGWFALPGVLGLMYATDARWGSWRIVLQSQAIGVALILLGAATRLGRLPDRPPDDLGRSSVASRSCCRPCSGSTS